MILKYKSKRSEIRKGLKRIAISIVIFAIFILIMCVVFKIAPN